jgi:hypothetical protein
VEFEKLKYLCNEPCTYLENMDACTDNSTQTIPETHNVGNVNVDFCQSQIQ